MVGRPTDLDNLTARPTRDQATPPPCGGRLSQTTFARPFTSSTGSTPQWRESALLRRLSPITNTASSGTRQLLPSGPAVIRGGQPVPVGKSLAMSSLATKATPSGSGWSFTNTWSSRTAMRSPGTATTRFTNVCRGSGGYAKTTTSPRAGAFGFGRASGAWKPYARLSTIT